MVAGLWCLLGIWIGGLLLFSVVVAPTAFSALPGPDLAGKIVGPVLRSLNLYGMVAGPALALTSRKYGFSSPGRSSRAALNPCLFVISRG